MVPDVDVVSSALESAVRDLTEGKDVAVAFSGGLDSGIVAALTGRYANSVMLYTVGLEDSYDVRMARNMSSRLGMRWRHILLDEKELISGLREMMLVTGTSNPLMLAFETPPFHVCKNCDEDLVIGGQGSDELFAGYSKYVGLGAEELSEMMSGDMISLLGPTMEHEKKVADHFNKTILYPFLDDRVVSAVRELGVEAVMSKEPESRKRMLKEVARLQGYPFMVDTEKKAAQYGSGTMDLVRRICKSKGIRYSDLVDQIRSDLWDSAGV